MEVGRFSKLIFLENEKESASSAELCVYGNLSMGSSRGRHLRRVSLPPLILALKEIWRKPARNLILWGVLTCVFVR